MKKIYAIIAAALLAVPALADEGMWLLPLIEKMNAKAIYSLGGRLSPEEIYSINHSSIKDAIVQFGRGCTGEIISDEGLLVTNHHCGYGSIQGLSSPEHNYLEDGFWAMNRTEELPVPGLTVRFLQSMTDVSAKLAKQSREEIAEQAKQANPGCDVQVVDFYNKNVAYLIISKIYRDVRFVGAPPASMGKFGGETDNWMWPRHTCDFSMFRVYAGKDNEPADYSADNVPMQPRQSLKVSLKGVEEGDFAMIMGYPGRTQRFQTAAQLEMMMAVNAIRIDARTARQNVMWEAMMADPVVRLQYASKYAGSANGWKKWQGMRDSFANLDIIGREKAKEQEFMNWVDKKSRRQKAYGNSLGVIETAVQEEIEANKAVTLLSESIGQIEVVSFAGVIVRGLTQLMALDKAGEDFRSRAKEIMDASKRMITAQYKDYSEDLDRKEAATLIRFYCERVKPEDVISYKDKKLTDYDPESLAAEIFDNTRLTSAEKLATLDNPAEIIKDPAVVLAGAITDGYRRFVKPIRDNEAVIADASKAFTAGLLEWKKGEASYPDANSTCRLTYGNVKSYSPKDGVLYRHYTTLKGVMEKEDPNNYEFRVPAKLKEIYNNRDYGQYANAAGELPTCFLTNLDITGGNSGSPVLDADGNLIGLAFDGNWEAMSSDVMFEPQLQRCICVDIRYVLLMMDKFGGAGYLLDEMKIVR